MHTELTSGNDGETTLTRCAICRTKFKPAGPTTLCTLTCLPGRVATDKETAA